jgi:glycosyltransferase involved in cell wall biosynthesis
VLLSIVIPTTGRRLLDDAVASALAQELPAGEAWEIVVVDNTPAGSIRERIAAHADPRLRWVHAPAPGVAEARNAGVAAAAGRYIAFLDDDEEASPGWAAALLARACRGAVAVVGPVEPVFEIPPGACPEAARRMYAREFALPDGADATALHAYLGTGNSLFDKTVCLPAKRPFAPEFNGLGGEDSAFLLALVDQGCRITWAADARVLEHVPADRLTFAALATRRFRNGQVRSLIRFRAGGLRRLECVAWMCIGLVQAAGYGLASLVAARLCPQKAPEWRLAACGGAGKVLWMPRFWKLTYGAPHTAAPASSRRMPS